MLSFGFKEDVIRLRNKLHFNYKIYLFLNFKDLRTIYRILAIIILLCDIEFVKMESSRHEAVYIKDEKVLKKGN